MNATPASVERKQKCGVHFEIYRFLKKAVNLPHYPYLIQLSMVLMLNISSTLFSPDIADFTVLHLILPLPTSAWVELENMLR